LRAEQIAILVRQWRQVEPILQALQARGIQYDCGGGTSLFATPLGYLLASGFVIGAGWNMRYGWKPSHLQTPPTSGAQWALQIATLLRLSITEQTAAKAWINDFSEEAHGDGTRPATLAWISTPYDSPNTIFVK
jgi:hypothetical protein